MRKNRLCGETVTLYHPDPAAQTVCRRVLRGVSWQQGRREKPDAAGTKQGTALLLVIPEAAGQYGADYTLDPGDRVLLGEGPGVAWADWPGFVPAAARERDAGWQAAPHPALRDHLPPKGPCPGCPVGRGVLLSDRRMTWWSSRGRCG